MSLVDQLVEKFKARPGEYIPGAAIERWVLQETKYTASNARRRLRELVEDGVLSQEERPYKGVNHAWYCYKPSESTAPKRAVKVEIRDGKPVAVEYYVQAEN